MVVPWIGLQDRLNSVPISRAGVRGARGSLESHHIGESWFVLVAGMICAGGARIGRQQCFGLR